MLNLKYGLILSMFLSLILPMVGVANDESPLFVSSRSNFKMSHMDLEDDQMNAWTCWRQAVIQVELAKIKHENAKKQYEKALELDKSNAITKENLVLANIAYENSARDIEIQSALLEKHKANYEHYRLKIIAIDQPTPENQLQAIAAKIVSVEAEANSHKIAILSANKIYEACKTKMLNGKKLADQNTIFESEMDQRTLHMKTAEADVNLAKQKLADTELKLQGLKLSLENVKQQLSK